MHLWRVEEWKKAGGRKGGGMDTAIRSARGKGTDAQFFEGADAKRGEVRHAASSAPLTRCLSVAFSESWCCRRKSCRRS